MANNIGNCQHEMMDTCLLFLKTVVIIKKYKLNNVVQDNKKINNVWRLSSVTNLDFIIV